jgi:hypothetical protein
MLQLLFEDTEKNTLLTECQIVTFPICWLPTLRGIFYRMQWDLVSHILYVMNGWESRYYKSLKDSLLSVSNVLLLVRVLPTLPYTVHYKNSSYIPNTSRLCKSLYHTMNLQDVHSVNWLATVSWRPYVYSLLHNTNCALLGPPSPSYTMNMSDENPRAIRSHYQQWQCSMKLWVWILGDYLVASHILPQWVGGFTQFLNSLWI